MGLFVKKTNTDRMQQVYSIGQNRTVLIVGLGNIGKEYNKTRHNIGFDCVDTFANEQSFGAWALKKDLKGHTASRTIDDTRVILLRPATFMNLSGEAVQAVQNFYKITNAQTLVVHDELDIPFGDIRTKQGGGSAGHNGLKSVIALCGEDFYRIRIGIANDFSPQADSADFVLGKFTKEEQGSLPKIRSDVSALLTRFVTNGTL